MQPFIAFCQNEYKLSSEAYFAAEVAILDVIINSPQFDSINSFYNVDNYIFAENELLPEIVSVQLENNNSKFKIVYETCENNHGYWILGHFVLNRYIEDPRDAVLQIEFIFEGNSKTLIGIDMEKGEDWCIKYFTILE